MLSRDPYKAFICHYITAKRDNPRKNHTSQKKNEGTGHSFSLAPFSFSKERTVRIHKVGQGLDEIHPDLRDFMLDTHYQWMIKTN